MIGESPSRNFRHAGNVQRGMGRRRCAAVVLGLLFAGPAVAACAQGVNTAQPGGNVSASSSATPEPTSSGPNTPSPAGQPTPGSSFSGAKPGELTVRGEVHEGVEAGCILLQTDDDKLYLLLGGDRALIASAGRLEVIGEPQPDLMTTCQQGTPFQVTQVRRI